MHSLHALSRERKPDASDGWQEYGDVLLINQDDVLLANQAAIVAQAAARLQRRMERQLTRNGLIADWATVKVTHQKADEVADPLTRYDTVGVKVLARRFEPETS
jgi:hypothetical protein